MRKLTKKQQSIIDELHNVEYFYTRYSSVKESTRLKYKVSNDYIDKLIDREVERIKLEDKDTLVFERWYV